MTQVAVQSSNAGAEMSATLPPEPVSVIAKVPPQPSKVIAPSEESVQSSITSKERDGILKQLNKTLEAFDTRVSLSLDDKSRQTVIKVIDNDSGKVVRQIPSEQLMRISERITELLGVIYDEKM